MTFDLLDRAFLQAASAGQQRTSADSQPSSAGCSAELHPATEPATAGAAAIEHPAAALPDVGGKPAEADPADETVCRLIEEFPDQWAAVMAAVEGARRAGSRVIAIAGHEPGEGRTTLLHGLSRLLTERGWQVTPFATATAWWQELVGDGATWQWRQVQSATADDRDLVLVDAGIWFPPGPLRPRHLLLTMFGYDAALLVRHHDFPASPVREAAIHKAGLQAIGEVVSFAPAPQQRAA